MNRITTCKQQKHCIGDYVFFRGLGHVHDAALFGHSLEACGWRIAYYHFGLRVLVDEGVVAMQIFLPGGKENLIGWLGRKSRQFNHNMCICTDRTGALQLEKKWS